MAIPTCLFRLKDNHPGLAYQVSTHFTDALAKYPGRRKLPRRASPAQKRGGGEAERRGITAASLDEPARGRVSRTSERLGAQAPLMARRRTAPLAENGKAIDGARYFITSVILPAEHLVFGHRHPLAHGDGPQHAGRGLQG